MKFEGEAIDEKKVELVGFGGDRTNGEFLVVIKVGGVPERENSQSWEFERLR
jgi:hypothetical protein